MSTRLTMAIGLAAALAAHGVTVRPADTGEALRNPGMGWVLHFYDNVPDNYGSRLAPSDTVDDFPGMTCVYLRIPWSYVEPEEGRFCWSVLDAPTQRWRDKGLQIALRISVCESWTRWATPEWVQKAGAKGHNFTPGRVDEKGPFWEPDYNDPVFLDKLDRFLAALAARYDGDPAVSFVDVGSFGVWGEGHLWASTQLKYPAETVIRHIDLYRKHFTRSLLVANDDFSFQGDAAIDYAREHGLALRDDSILVQPGDKAYFHAEMAQGFWPTVPTILESEHYGGSRDRGNWGDGHLYLKAVEEYHASYASIHWWPREFLAECGPLIAQINRRIGYRLLPVEVTFPERLTLGGEISFDWSWRNAGVAPCYAGGYPALTLTDAQGGIVGVFVDDALNVKDLAVGAADQVLAKASRRSFPLAYNQVAGPLDVWVSVGDAYGTPRYSLPLPDGRGKRYRIGSLQVSGDYAAKLGALRRDGDAWVADVTYTVHAEQAGVQPFSHFDTVDGRIAFQGNDGGGERTLAPGTVTVPLRFSPPAEARGKQFTLVAGLFRPAQIGQASERLRPDSGEGDKRVVLGQVRVDAAGVPSLAP